MFDTLIPIRRLTDPRPPNRGGRTALLVWSDRTAIARPMANDPPFTTLNHFAGDLGIPEESDNLRIGINDRPSILDLRLLLRAERLGRLTRLYFLSVVELLPDGLTK